MVAGGLDIFVVESSIFNFHCLHPFASTLICNQSDSFTSRLLRYVNKTYSTAWIGSGGKIVRKQCSILEWPVAVRT
jgi:hypothetical protein